MDIVIKRDQQISMENYVFIMGNLSQFNPRFSGSIEHLKSFTATNKHVTYIKVRFFSHVVDRHAWAPIP